MFMHVLVVQGQNQQGYIAIHISGSYLADKTAINEMKQKCYEIVLQFNNAI